MITSVSDLCLHLCFFVHISPFHVCQVVTFTKRIKMAVLFWIFFWDQICPKGQIGPKWSVGRRAGVSEWGDRLGGVD